MADISAEINAIRTARYGEDVRGALVDALNAVNDQVEDDTTSAGTSAQDAADSAAAAAQTALDLASTLEELEGVEEDVEEAEAARVQAENGRVEAEDARVIAEQERADAASGYVNQCAEYANQARQYASSDNALLSQSWAVGGTSTRYGEDTNNSKYWAEVAAQVVTEGGVASFNGRTGNVSPAAGDYEASDITRGAGTVESALGSIETALGNIGTMDSKDNTVTFTSGDVADSSTISAWTTVNPVASAETHATLFGKISNMLKNVRFLKKQVDTLNSNIGTVLTGTILNTTINARSSADIASLDLPAGTWVLCGSLQFTSNFTEATLMCYVGLPTGTPNGTVRGTGLNGGGLSTSVIVTLTSSATVVLSCNQQSNSNVTVNQIQHKAVRIK